MDKSDDLSSRNSTELCPLPAADENQSLLGGETEEVNSYSISDDQISFHVPLCFGVTSISDYLTAFPGAIIEKDLLPKIKQRFKEALIITEVYRALMIISAFLVCLSHGSNDVANAISPLLIIMGKHGYPDAYSFFIGSAGIAAGLLIMGQSVMDTVGKSVVVLDF